MHMMPLALGVLVVKTLKFLRFGHRTSQITDKWGIILIKPHGSCLKYCLKNVYTKHPHRKLSGFVEISGFVMTSAHLFSDLKFRNFRVGGGKQNGGYTAVVSTGNHICIIYAYYLNIFA